MIKYEFEVIDNVKYICCGHDVIEVNILCLNVFWPKNILEYN